MFPPGEFIREELEARGWTPVDLAQIMNCPVRLVNELIAGKKRITPRQRALWRPRLAITIHYIG